MEREMVASGGGLGVETGKPRPNEMISSPAVAMTAHSLPFALVQNRKCNRLFCGSRLGADRQDPVGPQYPGAAKAQEK